ncbi:MAG: hypothetical protein HYW49_11395 [Deltaproteobacteria bacterium]|nr:hypothetical protein [Deltaproteobacteria bacterium]
MNTRCAAIAAVLMIATLFQACSLATQDEVTSVSSPSAASTRNLGSSSKATVTVTLLQIVPAARNLSVNQSQQFVVTGGTPPYAFSISSGIGTVSSAGLYQAPANPGQAMIKVADAAANTAYAVVYVGELLTINPTSKTLGTNASFTFTASGGLAPYTFTVVSGLGAINPNTGAYTAPATSSSVVIRVTDFGGASASSNVAVTPVLSISPTPRYVPFGQTAQFAATGGTGPYTYTLVAGGGTVASGGLFTAAAATSTSALRVTDAAGSTADATVYSYQGPAVSPAVKYVAVGENAQFAVTGGISPYAFSIVLGGGFLSSGPTSTTFTAGAAPGDSVIRVTDGGGNTSDTTVHAFVPRKLALGSEHACALTRASLTSSTVNCWGRSQYGQRGDETFAIGDQAGEMGDALSPIKLGTGLVPDSIVGGYAGAFVKFTSGTAKGWGYNGSGALGNASSGRNFGLFPNEMGDHLPYLLLGTGKTAFKIAANPQGSGGCAILNGTDLGKVRCWGNNSYGTVGVGDSTSWYYSYGYGYYPFISGDNIPFVNLGLGRTATDLAYGSLHACAILDSGASGSRVTCWGYNGYQGQLGYGDTANRFSPGPIVDLGDDAGNGSGNPYYAKAIAAGFGHTCAILNNDKVKCWGRNNYGQLGLGDNSASKANIGDEAGEMGNALAFVDLGTGRTAKAISCGSEHTCAILDNDKLKCWGNNNYGQVGSGINSSSSQYPSPWYSIGAVAGEMGDQLPYVSLGTGRTVKKIKLGNHHTCAILDDAAGLNSHLKCWGLNTFAQLGLGHLNNVGGSLNNMGDNLAYVDLGSGRTVKDIAPQHDNTCALLDNNTVKCWGSVQTDTTDYGALGNENATLGDAPGEMAGSKTVNLGTNRYATDIEANSSNDQYTCSILNTGELKCWGANSAGQLGTGGEPPANSFPYHGDKLGTMGDGLPTAFVGFGRTVKQVATGASNNSSTCAILDDGAGQNSHLKCWGANEYGQLGLENTNGYYYFQDLVTLPYVNLGTVDGIGGTPLVAKQVSSGYYAYHCALLSNGGVKCWGNSPYGPNPWGNLGYGNSDPRGNAPNTMGDNLPFVNLGTDGSNNPWQVTQLSTSYTHSCALIAGGKIKCWGYNIYGQLGIGDTVNRGDSTAAGHLMGNALPFVDLGTGRTAKKVVTGIYHTCAVLDNNQIKCWGYNAWGQLGLGDKSGNNDNIGNQAGEMGDNLRAVNLGTGRTALDVFAGNYYTCAVLDNNGVKCWGYNAWGQLGIGMATANTGDNPLTLGDYLPYTLSPTVPQDNVYAGATSSDNLVYDFDQPVTTARSLVAGGTLTLELSGGSAPYSFTLLAGGGTLNTGTNTAQFTAPATLTSSPASTTVQVSDSNSHVTTITIHVFLPRKIAAGDASTCVVDPTSSTSSNTKCFGRNNYGQLGNEKAYLGAKSSQMGDNLPAVDFGTDSLNNPWLATSILAGQYYTCAVLTDGNVKCFGYNGYGALANATNATSYGASLWSMGNLLPFALFGAGKTVASIKSSLTNDYNGFNCAIFSGANAGKVKCWGPNYYSNLGTGDTTAYGYYLSTSGDNMPFLNLGAGRTAVQVAVGRLHACALLDDGTVKCWGYNGYGELGLGDTATRTTPTGPVDLGTGRTAVEIAAGYDFTCALLDSGAAGSRVKCWGRNDWGNLGYENTTDRGGSLGTMGDNLPYVSLGTGRTAKHLAVGHLQACAILDNDLVKCWGNNGSGELGLGNTTNYGNAAGTMGDNLPYVSLGTGRTATAIAMGANHSCVILDDGGMKCWGYNAYGQLGLGDTVNRGDNMSAGHLMGDDLPQINLGSGVNDKPAMISTGNSHTCALLQSGRVKCWGQASGNDSYHSVSRNPWVGDEPGEMGPSLESINLSSTDYAIDVKMGAGAQSVCTLMNSGKMKCFGYNTGYYNLGLGDGTNRGDSPAAGHQMGDALSYVDLGTGRTVKSIKQTAYHACAILDDSASGSHLKCWGYGAWGSLGYENTDYRGQGGTMGDNLPYVNLGTVGGDGTGGALVAVQASGVLNNCAILSNGRVKCWGYNSNGELGLGDTTPRGDSAAAGHQMGDNLPYVNLGTVNGDGTGGALTAVQVDSGYGHNCAILGNSKVKCWGYNGYGQLGTGNSVNRGDSGTSGHEMGDSLPYVDLGTNRTAKKLALGFYHSCALLDNGRVKCWGYGVNGQLGIPDGGQNHGYYSGDMGDRLVAVDLGTDTGAGTAAGGRTLKAIDIAAGTHHTCATLDDNQIKCWGYNGYGQLGLGHSQNIGLTPLSLGNGLPAIPLR